MKISDLKKPINSSYIINKPLIFAVMSLVTKLKRAICLAKTINHYNETGERLVFKNVDITELELLQ